MTRLLREHPPIDVELDPGGRLVAIRWNGQREPVEVCNAWRVAESWWREPIERDYCKVVGRRWLALVYLDRVSGTWHLERLYDCSPAVVPERRSAASKAPPRAGCLQAMGAPIVSDRTRRSAKSATTKASAWTSLERVDRCCTPSPQSSTGPLPVDTSVDGDRSQVVT